MSKTGLSDTHLDELMSELRDRIRQRRTGQKTGGLEPDDLSVKSFGEQCSHHKGQDFGPTPLVGVSAVDRGGYGLPDLLAFDGRYFVENAYHCILKREPDSQAYDVYLQRLLNGTMSRVEVLGCLRYSREGRSQRVKVKGLFALFYALKAIRFWSAGFARLVGEAVDEHLTPVGQSEWHAVRSELSHLKDRLRQVEQAVDEQSSRLFRELRALRGAAGSAGHCSGGPMDKLPGERQGQPPHPMASQEGVLDELRTQLQESRIEISRLRRLTDSLLAEREKGAGQGPGSDQSFLDRFDYLGFENRLRGSEAQVREHHRAYLPYFRGRDLVLDIGCGRGEFLELLDEAGIKGEGVDLNPDMVRHCREKGLRVAQGDALAYLQSLPDDSLGGIFCAQLVEHLSIDATFSLVRAAHQKLRTGGVLVVETLNPESLLVIYRWFWLDPTHVRLVHPETLKFVFEAVGFQEVSTRIMPAPPGPILVPALSSSAIAWRERASFNQATQHLNELLYAGFDYAVIGNRQQGPPQGRV